MSEDAPVFVKRTKSKNAARQARVVEVPDPEAQEDTRTLVSNFKHRNKKPKPQQRLSFGTEDDVSVFNPGQECLLTSGSDGVEGWRRRGFPGQEVESQ